MEMDAAAPVLLNLASTVQELLLYARLFAEMVRKPLMRHVMIITQPLMMDAPQLA